MPAKSEQTLKVNPEDLVFVISPIGAPGSEARIKADRVLSGLIKPACKEAGFAIARIKRGDDINESGKITKQIIRELYNAKMAIVDLTDQNPNVLFELALRYAFNKLVVHIIQHDQVGQIPFDIKDQRVIPYTTDIADVNKLRETIAAQIQHCLSLPEEVKLDNPVNDALEFNFITSTIDPSNDDNKKFDILFQMISQITDKIDSIPADELSFTQESELVIPSERTYENKSDVEFMKRFGIKSLHDIKSIKRKFDFFKRGNVPRTIENLNRILGSYSHMLITENNVDYFVKYLSEYEL